MVAPTFLPNFPNTKGQTSEKSYSEKMSEHKVSVVLKSIMLNYSISNIHTENHLTIKCQKTTTTKKKKKITFSEISFSFQVGAAPLIPSIRVV